MDTNQNNNRAVPTEPQERDRNADPTRMAALHRIGDKTEVGEIKTSACWNARMGVFWDVRMPIQWAGDNSGRQTWEDAVQAIADSIQEWLTDTVASLINDIRNDTSGVVFVEDNPGRAAWAIVLLMAIRNRVNASVDVISVEVSTDIAAQNGQPGTLADRIQPEKGTLFCLGLDIEALPDSDPFLQAAAKLGLYCPRPDLSSAPVDDLYF